MNQNIDGSILVPRDLIVVIDELFRDDNREYGHSFVIYFGLWFLGSSKSHFAPIWFPLLVRHCDGSQSSGTQNKEHLVAQPK